MGTAIFSSYYMAPIEFYYYLTQYENIIIDIHEHFVKQTYRSRSYIMGPNGVQNLSIPLKHVKRRKNLKEAQISYAENWQKIHWKSIEAGYRRSPYFEFYEDHFYPFYHQEQKYLYDFNEAIHHKIVELIGLNYNKSNSEEYISNTEGMDDYRNSFNPKSASTHLQFPEYLQVFNDRNPFTPNMSIIDLLFNEGPNSLNYLKTISKVI